MDEKEFENLDRRVKKFMFLELPGQPQIMHMGTSGLVNDLWIAVKKLREQVKNMALGDLRTAVDTNFEEMIRIHYTALKELCRELDISLEGPNESHWSQSAEEIYSSEIQQNNGSDNGALSEPKEVSNGISDLIEAAKRLQEEMEPIPAPEVNEPEGNRKD